MLIVVSMTSLGDIFANWATFQSPRLHLFGPNCCGKFKVVFHFLVKTALVI